MQTVTYYQSSSKILLLGLLSLAFTIAGVLMAIFGDTSASIKVILYICAAFFLICTIYFIRALFKSKEYVVLTENGLYDYSNAIATNDILIEWNQVDYIDLYEMSNNRFIGVHLYDPAYLDDKRSSFKAVTASANKKLGFGDVVMSTNSLKDVTPEDVLSKMNEYLNHSKNTPQDL